MSIRYTTNISYKLVFRIEVEGAVQQSDVIGAIVSHSTSRFPDHNLIKLQTDQKVAKLTLKLSVHDNKTDKSQKTEGLLIIPVDMDDLECCLFASEIESITQIKLYNCKIEFKGNEDVSTLDYTKILNRASLIHNKYFKKNSVSLSQLKKQFVKQINLKKAHTTEENCTIGATFHESPTILVVEGRADVVNLYEKCRIGYTFGIGGAHFDKQKVKEYLKGKKIITFFDGDEGGMQARRRLANIVPVDYNITVDKNKNIEDLESEEILKLIENVCVI